jgi:Fic family protein
MNSNYFSREITAFHGRISPERGKLVGYGAILEELKLPVPFPSQLALISERRRQYQTSEWIVFTSRHQPADTLYGHLVFALKYEGINLLLLKKLFNQIEPETIEEWIKNEPHSQYCRKLWFLYEWLIQKKLNLSDLTTGNYVALVDDELQYSLPLGHNSPRHRIRNNLPGTVNFCPLIRKTIKLDSITKEQFSEQIITSIQGVHKDILLRTSAFLMLKDSKASFTIEGENPTQNRAVRWGKAIGQAGSAALSKEELLRLQQIVIENNRFLTFGYRTEGGFVGEHDRSSGEPIPEHISARWQDLDILMNGLLETASLLEKSDFHPVFTAAVIAFGFVFIHPFIDGNGRIHRYLVHHLLSKMKFTPDGIIFPVSAAILERINDYKKTLETFSQPLLEFINWEKTNDNNIRVLNETIDYYRYFDATSQAEFLFESVNYTIVKILPEEVRFIKNFDAMKNWLDNEFQMPDKTVSMLIRFLEQNNGTLSKRAKYNEFSMLTETEVKDIEQHYKLYFEE